MPIIKGALDFTLPPLDGVVVYERSAGPDNYVGLGEGAPLGSLADKLAALKAQASVKGPNQSVLAMAKGLVEDNPGDARVQDAVLAALGYNFAGPSNFKVGWNKLQKGLADADPVAVNLAKGVYRKELNKLTGKLPPEFQKSPLMREVLIGAQDPVKLASHIKGLTKKLIKDGGFKNADEVSTQMLETVYAQSYGSITQGIQSYVLPFLSKDSKLREVYAKTTATVETFKDLEADATTLWKKYGSGGQEMDAAGIADCSKFTVKTVQAVTNFVTMVSNDPSTAGAAKQVMAWAAILTGCATGIAAGAAIGPWGAAAGAVACGIAVVTQALVTFFSSRPDVRGDNQLAIFLPYTPQKTDEAKVNQVGIIATDAERLATTLADFYDFKTYRELYVRVANTDRYGDWFVSAADTEGHPTTGGTGKYPPMASLRKGTGIRPTGYTMVHALTALDKTDYGDRSQSKNAAGFGLGVPAGGAAQKQVLDAAANKKLDKHTAGSWIVNLLYIFAAPARVGAEKAVGAIETDKTTPGGAPGTCWTLESCLGKRLYGYFYDVNVRAIEHMATFARNPNKLEKAVQFLEGYMLGYKEDRTQNWLEDLVEAITDTLADVAMLFGGAGAPTDFDLIAPFEVNLIKMSETEIRTWVLKNAPKAFETFRRMDELLNFYAATSMYETSLAWAAIKKNPTWAQPIPRWWPYISETNGLPIRFLAVGGGHRGEPDDGVANGDEYHKYCWSNLEGCERGRPTTQQVGRINKCIFDKEGFGCGKDGCVSQFRRQLLSNKDFCAAKELAYIRLLSALSFMHMQYLGARESDTVSKQAAGDLIQRVYKEHTANKDDALLKLNRTLDPRERVLFPHGNADMHLARHWQGSQDSAYRPRPNKLWKGPRDQTYVPGNLDYSTTMTVEVPAGVDTSKPWHTSLDPEAMMQQALGLAVASGQAEARVAKDAGLRIASLYKRLAQRGSVIDSVQATARYQAHVDDRAQKTLYLVKALLRDEPEHRKQIVDIATDILNGKLDFKTSVATLGKYATRCNRVQYVDAKGDKRSFLPQADSCFKPMCCPADTLEENQKICAFLSKDQGIKCPQQCLDPKGYLFAPTIRPAAWPKGCATTPWEVAIGRKPCPGVTPRKCNFPNIPQQAAATTNGLGAITQAGVSLSKPLTIGAQFDELKVGVKERFDEYKRSQAVLYDWHTYLKHLEYSRKLLAAQAQQGSGISAGTIAVAAGAALLAIKLLK